MAHIQGLEKMSVEEVLTILNNIPDERNSKPFETARTAVQIKSIISLTNSIDEFRKSNDESSNAMKRWAKVLAAATIVLAAATVILAGATIILALK